jgi:hypothetical protein
LVLPVSPLLIILMILSAIAGALAIAAIRDEIQDISRPRPRPRHSWESTQGETTRLDDRPAKLVHLDEDQAVWRRPE